MIIEGPQEGAWNMCVDEALLLNGEQPTLRLYSWKKPTVSYGYFQQHEDFQKIPPQWDRVRRLTGGGAIAHHHEITYSLSGPESEPLLKDTKRLYHRVHEAWKNALASLPVQTFFRGGLRSKKSLPWCFSQGDPYDLVTKEGVKILGSAQRRTHHRVLIHGSLPLCPQPLMGGTGLEILCHRSLDWQETVLALLPPFQKSLGISWANGTLTSFEKNIARQIQKHRYLTNQWVKSRHHQPFLEKISLIP